METGDRIIIHKNRGFRISYEVGNEELRDIELVHRKDIAGKFEEILIQEVASSDFGEFYLGDQHVYERVCK